MIGRRFVRDRKVVLTVVDGPEPVGAAGAAALAVQYGLNMAGHNGSVRWGEPSSPAKRFTGYAESPQRLIGAGTYGSNRNRIAAGFGTAFPATSVPPGMPGSLQSMFPAVPR